LAGGLVYQVGALRGLVKAGSRKLDDHSNRERFKREIQEKMQYAFVGVFRRERAHFIGYSGYLGVFGGYIFGV